MDKLKGMLKISERDKKLLVVVLDDFISVVLDVPPTNVHDNENVTSIVPALSLVSVIVGASTLSTEEFF